MTSTTISRNSTNFDDVSIVFNSDKRSIGYIENYQVQLDSPLTRLQSMSVENIQFTSSKYLIDNGNNLLAMVDFEPTGSLDTVYEVSFKQGTYTGEELAEELNNRMSFSDTGVPGLFLDYIWSYDSNTKKFIAKGGDDPREKGIFNRFFLPLSVFLTAGRTMSTLAPVISLFEENPEIENVPTTIPIADPDNPGEFMLSSSYGAQGEFTLKSQTKTIELRDSDEVISFTSTANITGFQLAQELTDEMTTALGSRFLVHYNTHNYKFTVRRRAPAVGISTSVILSEETFHMKVWPGTLGGGGEALTSIYESGEIHGVAVTHTITASVNDLFTIDEGNGNIDITLPATVSATLPELAVILQTEFNNASLSNTYEITFSGRTGKFRIKVQKQGSVFPTFSLILNTASGIFGFTTGATGSIIKSDTRQFELFPSITASITIDPLEIYNMPIGSPTPTEAAQQLEDLITPIYSNFTIVYNTISRKFTIGNLIQTILLWGNNTVGEGASKLFGNISGAAIVPIIATETIFDSISTFYGPQYIYIKSNTLAKRKSTINGIDTSHQDIIGKIILNKRPIDFIFNESANLGINKLASKTEIQTIDIRIEDEDGLLYNTNGIDWAFSLLFEKF